ncbi:GerMN domain-containing protein [Priestia abyssalis]|uniref:GerMN domain-containing protein n=1 Tax=Priestia abyssalis TaxID=1221450 RepID=UPI000994915F|nr:GerMN domain-containing protein [Priestia abyssalis]
MRQWDKKQIEELLTRMPKLQDGRSAQEVYRNVQQRIEKSDGKPKRFWLMPGLASVAVALLLVVLALPLLPIREQEVPVPGQNQLTMEKEINPAVKEEKLNRKVSIQPSLLKPEGKKYITVAAPDRNIQFVVPLTYMVKQEGDTLVQTLEGTAAAMNEERLGLSRNIIQDLHVSDDQNKVTVQVKEDHPFGNGSASENMFIDSIEETFRWLPYDKVEFTTDDHKGISLGNMGELAELPINHFLRKAYLTYQADEDYPKLLVPTVQSYESLQAAMEAMKRGDEMYELRASIPTDVEIKEIKGDHSHLTVRFSENTKLSNEESDVYMLHAIMLAARDFGYKSVQFEGGIAEKIGDITLKKRQVVPQAPNVVTIREKHE